jgi:hypothetical protein
LPRLFNNLLEVTVEDGFDIPIAASSVTARGMSQRASVNTDPAKIRLGSPSCAEY